MKFGGIQRFSLIDYPGKIAAVLFSQGCTFSCPFCHNPDLVDPKQFTKPLSLQDIKAFLHQRKNELEAVVFSGGEPTIHPSLPSFIHEVKQMGFLIKLDTSGTNPHMIASLLSQKLLDYIAMDIKAPLSRYSEMTKSSFSNDLIKKSIELVLTSSISYEFRSTIFPSFHKQEDLIAMAQMIPNARLYILQNFRNEKTLSSHLKNDKSFSKDEMLSFQKLLSPFVQECQIR